MANTGKIRALLKNAGVSAVNKPKRTPNHPTKSHVVVAKSGEDVKTIEPKTYAKMRAKRGGFSAKKKK